MGNEVDLTRRRLLMQTLFGAGLLGLRSLATGIPIHVLANPRRALAEVRRSPEPKAGSAAQYVILSASGEGDPIGCNAPGMYVDPAIKHPPAPSMAPSPVIIGGRTYTAARPWAQLPADLLERTCFFHHATHSVVHSEQQKVMALADRTPDHEMLVSLLAARLGPALGTVQPEPIVLGPRKTTEEIVYQRRPQPIVAPSALALLLGSPRGALGRLTRLRDRDLDRLNAHVKQEGIPARVAFIDQYVQSQAQLRAVSDQLLNVLQGIKDDSVSSQLLAAVTLLRMNVAPVVSLHIPFGGDNHSDASLAREAEETVSGVSAIGQLWSLLKTVGLQDRVTFLSLNVFGRTLKEPNGRAHNANHHVAVMFGRRLRGSVIGGIEPLDADYGAMSIDAARGEGVPHDKGSVRFDKTLQAMAMTFGIATGVDREYVSHSVGAGTAITRALRT